MERKGRTVRRQRRSRSWLFSPIIIAQLAVVMVVAGVGVAFALPQNPVSTTAAPWAGTASVTESAHFTVTNYTPAYNNALTEVTGISVTLTNSDSVAHNATLKVAILDGTGAVQATGTISSASYAAGANSVVVTLSGNVALANFATVNVLVTEP